MATRLTTILVIVIVGATFIAGLIVGAQRDDASGPVDMIIVNGKVYPGAGADLQEAVAVRGNQLENPTGKPGSQVYRRFLSIGEWTDLRRSPCAGPGGLQRPTFHRAGETAIECPFESNAIHLSENSGCR